MASAIVTPAPLKKRLKGPVIRLRDEANDSGQEQPKRSAIVEPKRRPSSIGTEGSGEPRSAIVEPKRKPGNSMLAHLLDHDVTDEERNRRADLAEAMFRTIVRRARAVWE
jgi:hypothetical protein